MEQYQLKQKKSETDRASQQHIAEVISYIAFVFQVLNLVVEITSTSVTVETMFSCLFYIKQAVLAEKRGDLRLYLQGRYCNLVLLMPLLL